MKKKNLQKINNDYRSDKMTDKEKERFWQLRLHQDVMFNDRLNIFLISESILIAIVGVLKDNTNTTALFSIIILGLFLTCIWLYVQAKQRYILNLAKSKCKEYLPEYKEFKNDEGREKYKISVIWLLAYGVPIVIAGIWIALMFYIK